VATSRLEWPTQMSPHRCLASGLSGAEYSTSKIQHVASSVEQQTWMETRCEVAAPLASTGA